MGCCWGERGGGLSGLGVGGDWGLHIPRKFVRDPKTLLGMDNMSNANRNNLCMKTWSRARENPAIATGPCAQISHLPSRGLIDVRVRGWWCGVGLEGWGVEGVYGECVLGGRGCSCSMLQPLVPCPQQTDV